MIKKQKFILLFLFSWAGTILLVLAGVAGLPEFFAKKEQLETLKKKLENRQAIESRMNTFLNRFKNETINLKASIARKKQKLNENEYNCPTEDKIPEFINELQYFYINSGASLINLGYEKRIYKNNFVVLPFVAEFRASYEGFRKVLHQLETHRAGVRIDSLEFISLNDEEHKIKVKTKCSLRFEKIGR
ncbi:MAG: hypothetical protein ACQETH_12115 [Candidatus Rifleibacteriota bacterium]